MRVLTLTGRPFVILRHGERRAKNPKWGKVRFSVVRYLDGQIPRQEDVTAGKLAKAKQVGETQSVYWLRVNDLLDGGMDPERAKEQARAELEKGVLATAAF